MMTQSKPTIPTVTAATFDQLVLKGEGPIAVEFMSPECSHCQTMEPIIEQVAELVKTKEKIFKVDLDQNQELGAKYEIQGTPTLTMFLKDNVKKAASPHGNRYMDLLWSCSDKARAGNVPDGHPNCSTCGHLKLRRVINTMTLSVAQFAA